MKRVHRLADDMACCAVPCEEMKGRCARANAPKTEPRVSVTHYRGGRDCEGFIEFEACRNCKHWQRDEPPSGRMPGVTDKHRICDRPRSAGKKTWKEYRHPDDWCDVWAER